MADFEAATGIKVTVEYLTYADGDDKVNTAIEGNAAPDLIMEGPERLVANWGAKGKLVNIADLFDDTDKQEINAAALAACFADDNTAYEYPLVMTAHCMAINKTVFEAAASVEHGIVATTEEARAKFEKSWEQYKAAGKKVVKFVPASGAASRMFKDMFAFVDAEYDKPTTDFEKKYFDQIRNFAFYDELDAVCLKNEGAGIETLLKEGNYKAVAAEMLKAEGLNYGQLPKGMLLFHKYAEGARTPNHANRIGVSSTYTNRLPVSPNSNGGVPLNMLISPYFNSMKYSTDNNTAKSAIHNTLYVFNHLLVSDKLTNPFLHCIKPRFQA